MGTEKINRLKIVLVEQGKTGKWDHIALVFQCDPAFIGNADEDSLHIECGRKKIDKQRNRRIKSWRRKIYNQLSLI